jgi:hypothetical protein
LADRDLGQAGEPALRRNIPIVLLRESTLVEAMHDPHPVQRRERRRGRLARHLPAAAQRSAIGYITPEQANAKSA